MWEEYKRTLLGMQLFILAAALFLLLYAQVPWLYVLFVFLAMQLGALSGSAFSAWLKRRLQKRHEIKPIDRQ